MEWFSTSIKPKFKGKFIRPDGEKYNLKPNHENRFMFVWLYSKDGGVEARRLIERKYDNGVEISVIVEDAPFSLYGYSHWAPMEVPEPPKEKEQWLKDARWNKARLLHGFYGLSIGRGLDESDRVASLKNHDLVADFLIRNPEMEVKYLMNDCAWRVWKLKGMPTEEQPTDVFGYYDVLQLAKRETKHPTTPSE